MLLFFKIQVLSVLKQLSNLQEDIFIILENQKKTELFASKVHFMEELLQQ